MPDHLIQFQNKPIIRIFRVIGGLSLIITLGQIQFEIPSYLFYLSFCISFLFLFYLAWINTKRIKHINKVLKSDQLDVKNSL